MRATVVTMDPLDAPVLLESRETVVTPDLLVPVDLLVPQDPLDPPDLLEDLETVESLVLEVPLDLLEPLEPEVLLDPLESVVRREVPETREREA